MDYYCVLRTSGECLGYNEAGEPQDDQQTQNGQQALGGQQQVQNGQQQAQNGEQAQQDQHHNTLANPTTAFGRDEYRRLATMEGVCRFPTPDTTPAQPANLPYTLFTLVMRPTPLLWDTFSFPDDVWYNLVHQFPLYPRRKMSVFEAAFILNHLHDTDDMILSRYRFMFAHVPSTDAEVQSMIDEWRRRAKENIWSPAETDIIRIVLEQGGSSEEAFFVLREKWLFYPKSYNDVYNKYMEMFVDMC